MNKNIIIQWFINCNLLNLHILKKIVMVCEFIIFHTLVIKISILILSKPHNIIVLFDNKIVHTICFEKIFKNNKEIEGDLFI